MPFVPPSRASHRPQVPPPYPDPPPYALPLALSDAVDAAAQTVIREVPCRQCGYPLCGLPVDGRCPECGTRVALTMSGHLLRYARPDLVHTLHGGMLVLLAGMATTLAGVFVCAVVPLAGGLAVIGALLIAVGGWMLTVTIPGGIDPERDRRSRRNTRAFLTVGLVKIIPELILMTTGLSLGAPEMQLLRAFAVLIWLAGQLLLLDYLAHLAPRLPDPSLEARARHLLWATVVSYGALILVGGLAVVLAFASTGAATPFAETDLIDAGRGLGCLFLITGIAWAVIVLLFIMMLDRFRARLGEEARASEGIWARTAPEPRTA